MQIHSLQPTSAVQSATRTNSPKASSPAETNSAVGSIATDQLDLSSEAQEIIASQGTQSASSDTEIRVDRVAALRQAIADGSYETPEKLSAALDRMLDTFA